MSSGYTSNKGVLAYSRAKHILWATAYINKIDPLIVVVWIVNKILVYRLSASSERAPMSDLFMRIGNINAYYEYVGKPTTTVGTTITFVPPPAPKPKPFKETAPQTEYDIPCTQ